MRVVTIAAIGPASGLVVKRVADLTPGGGEVLVQVAAAGVGLVDVLRRRDGLGGTRPGHVLGGEIVGTVARVSADIDSALVGRRVFAQSAAGGYAEQVVAAAACVVPLPNGLPLDDALALGVNALVAKFALDMGRLAPGERVLVRGASGVTGFHAVQLAQAHGGRVTAVTPRPDEERLAALRVEAILSRE